MKLNSSVGNDKVEVANAIRNTRDTRGGGRVVETINLGDKERALGAVRKL